MKTQELIEELKMMFQLDIIDTKKALKYLDDLENKLHWKEEKIIEMENKLEAKVFYNLFHKEKTFQTPLGEVRIYADNMDLMTRLEKSVEHIDKVLKFGNKVKFY